MATTSYGVNAAEAVKLWSRRLMHEALKQTWASKFWGTSSNSLMQIKDDTSKGPGDRITCILRMLLSGDGIEGDGTLEGNEEALTTHTDNIFINQLRHAVRSGGKMSEQRIPFSVREEARMGLADWFADRFDTAFMNQLGGNTAQTDNRFTGHNATVTPDASHVLFASQAIISGHASESSISASDVFKITLIDQAIEEDDDLVACRQGHLDDFPWLYYVHRGATDCPGALRLLEVGVSGSAADVVVRCDRCNQSRSLSDAFGTPGIQNMPQCRGRNPHLRNFDDDGCEDPATSLVSVNVTFTTND